MGLVKVTCRHRHNDQYNDSKGDLNQAVDHVDA
jgi:hypothetical protein